MTTPEGEVVRHLVHKCMELGFHQRKVSYEGHIGAPDRLVFGRGVCAWVELKAFGRLPTKEQLREHERLRNGGMKVYVCDSKSSVDTVMNLLVRKADEIMYKPKTEIRPTPAGGFKEASITPKKSRSKKK